MPNTYTRIHLHVVFAVKFRQALISKEWKERLHQYITGIIQRYQHKVLAINSMPDHVHILFGMRPDQSLSELMRMVKGDSSEWINQNKLSPYPFRWQEGYGAFSYAPSQLPEVVQYIQQQEEHHSKKSFRDEYIHILQLFGIDYNEKYIFTAPE